MDRVIRFNPRQRNTLFEATARQMKVAGSVVEKDFWVCVVLDYLFCHSKFRDWFVFKGGTSLSKCYGVIDRFSEDIDLVMKWDYLGYSDHEVYQTRTKNQDYIFECTMNAKASSFIQGELKNDIETNLVSGINGMSIDSDPNDPMVLFVNYPSNYDSGYILHRVKLEIGPVAAKTPSEAKYIEPYCLRLLGPIKNNHIRVNTVSIARTFWEKLLILYSECHRPPSKKMPLRYSRHYYDVCRIYHSPYFAEIIRNKSLFEEVKSFKSKYYRSAWSKVEGCTLGGITIVPNQYRLDEIRKDYESMALMIFGERPDFKSLVEELTMLQTALRII